MNVLTALKLLDSELQLRGIERTIHICGGAALILLKVTSRSTMDIDILKPSIDPLLKEASRTVAKSQGLSEDWLNNGPINLLEHLDQEWEQRCNCVFNGDSLKVYCLARADLLKTKLWAACDRIEDVPDCVALKPTSDELESAMEWVLKQDAAPIWPKIVQGCVAEIKKKLHDSKSI